MCNMWQRRWCLFAAVVGLLLVANHYGKMPWLIRITCVGGRPSWLAGWHIGVRKPLLVL